MIIGSGLLANSFSERISPHSGVWIYAAGVSNSSCIDFGEFERERVRLNEALNEGREAKAFIYFSTCSVDDPQFKDSKYVIHKLSMEKLVRGHSNFLIARLPQVAGKTSNPHTLLNYLHSKISRSEAFDLWTKASRNIIDVEDVASIVIELINSPEMTRRTINIANPESVSVADIVCAMENEVGKKAVTRNIDDGFSYFIDTSAIEPIINCLGLRFPKSYIQSVIKKYY